MNKPGTASAYRKLAQERRANRPTEMVTMPSGFVWELRAPDLEGDVLTGRIPHSLVDLGQQIWGMKATGNKPVVSEADVTDGLVYMREMVRNACVNPRIVMGASKADEIDPAEIDPEDFHFIFNWCMAHGGIPGVAGLETFRQGPVRGTNSASPGGKKLRRKAVAVSKG